MSEDWITTTAAAALSGYTREHIRRLVADGKVKGHMFADIWQIDRQTLLAYVKAAEKRGAKRGPKTRT